MLVMRRRAGESFLVGPEVEIQILEVSHGRVRIGVTAPGSITIVRKEVALTKEENLTAARGLAGDGIAWISEQLRGAGALTSPRQPGAREEKDFQKNGRDGSGVPDM
jgi:carbon storage regulator